MKQNENFHSLLQFVFNGVGDDVSHLEMEVWLALSAYATSNLADLHGQIPF